MKTALPVLSLILTICCWNLAAVPQCRVEKMNYRGWDALKMSNDLVELYIVPDIGGRIIQFVFEGHEWLFVNDSPGGWLASVDGKTGYVLVQRYDYFPGKKYPDDCSVEFWVNGAGSYIAAKKLIQNEPNPQKTPYYLEMEIFSPLVTLSPRQSYTFRTEWKAMKGGLPALMREVGLKVSRP